MSEALLALLQIQIALLFFALGLPALIRELGTSHEVQDISRRRMKIGVVSFLSFVLLLMVSYSLYRAGDPSQELAADHVVGIMAVFTGATIVATVIWLNYYFQRVTASGWARVLRRGIVRDIDLGEGFDRSKLEDLLQIAEHASSGAQKDAIILECGKLLEALVDSGKYKGEINDLIRGLVSAGISSEGRQGSPKNIELIVSILKRLAKRDPSIRASVDISLTQGLADLGEWAIRNRHRVLALRIVHILDSSYKIPFMVGRQAIGIDWVVVSACLAAMLHMSLEDEQPEVRHQLAALIILASRHRSQNNTLLTRWWRDRELGDFAESCNQAKLFANNTADFAVSDAVEEFFQVGDQPKPSP